MRTSAVGRKLIEEFEGLYLHTYNDGGGVPTIGYGHTTAAGLPVVHYGMTITADQADQILSADLASVEVDVNRLVKVPINQNQFDALVSFHFNTGGLARASVLSDVNHQHFGRVPADLNLWDHDNGKVLSGLLRRRIAEGKLFMTPAATVPATPTRLQLGKKPARLGAALMSRYIDLSKLPAAPAVFGMQRLIPSWGMLANDKVGDCVWAGAAHEEMIWHHEGGIAVTFTDDTVLADYSVTGYTSSDPASDQGTDMLSAAQYRQRVGIIDTQGKRHKIDGFAALPVGDVDALIAATYLLGAVGVGLRFPSTAEDQFDNAEPWSHATRATIEGGHYVPVLGRNTSGNILCVTWGRLHAMTPEFYAAYSDEAFGYLNIERLRNDVSPEGFNLKALKADLAALSGQKGDVNV